MMARIKVCRGNAISVMNRRKFCDKKERKNSNFVCFVNGIDNNH